MCVMEVRFWQRLFDVTQPMRETPEFVESCDPGYPVSIRTRDSAIKVRNDAQLRQAVAAHDDIPLRLLRSIHTTICLKSILEYHL
jgi:hypothetical protein